MNRLLPARSRTDAAPQVLPVRALRPAVDFYRESLGFALIGRSMRRALLELGPSEVRIELRLSRKISPIIPFFPALELLRQNQHTRTTPFLKYLRRVFLRGGQFRLTQLPADLDRQNAFGVI